MKSQQSSNFFNARRSGGVTPLRLRRKYSKSTPSPSPLASPSPLSSPSMSPLLTSPSMSPLLTPPSLSPLLTSSSMSPLLTSSLSSSPSPSMNLASALEKRKRIFSKRFRNKYPLSVEKPIKKI